MLSVAFAISASIILTLYFVTPEQVTQFCTEDISTVELNGLSKTVVDGVNLYIDDIDRGIEESTEKYMCTDYCPCGEIPFEKWDAQTQASFKTNKRYNFEGDQYTTFIDCYNDKKAGWEANDDLKPINESVLAIVKTLEDTYNCSGLCEKPTFWTHKPVTQGPPPDACIYALKNDFDANASILGWLMVAIAVTIILSLFSHCGLYLTDDEKLKRLTRKRTFIMD